MDMGLEGHIELNDFTRCFLRMVDYHNHGAMISSISPDDEKSC